MTTDPAISPTIDPGQFKVGDIVTMVDPHFTITGPISLIEKAAFGQPAAIEVWDEPGDHFHKCPVSLIFSIELAPNEVSP
jgi:hypothetical protein